MPGVHVTVNNYLNLAPLDFFGVCEEIVSRLIAATPVDTGFCAEHWRYVIISDNVVEIWNDTEYLSYLEDGHSKQADAGWIEDILNSITEIVFNYFN